jgi:hypothetical protein
MISGLRSLLVGAMSVAALALAAGAQAQTIGSDLGGNNQGLIESSPIVGQTIVPPAAEMESYTFYFRQFFGGALSVIPEVHEVAPGPGPGQMQRVGAALFTGAPFSIVNAEDVYTPYTIATLGLILDPNKTYLLSVRQTDPSQIGLIEFGEGGPYTDGEKLNGPDPFPSGQDDTDLRFSAVFSAVEEPLPTAVPTMSEWAMILMAMGLAGGATLVMQRRRMI